MSELDFVTFATDNDGRRWWVLRGPAGAVSLTALVAPPVIAGDVDGPDGVRLLAECFTAHLPGDGKCPALPDGCASQGDALSGAREVLLAWVSAGWDDNVVLAALEDLYRRELDATEAYAGRHRAAEPKDGV